MVPRLLALAFTLAKKEQNFGCFLASMTITVSEIT